jgi:hypothetical protein
MKKPILILLTALLFACCEKEELNTPGGGRMNASENGNTNHPECPPKNNNTLNIKP